MSRASFGSRYRGRRSLCSVNAASRTRKIFGKLPRNNALLNAAKAVRPDATAHGMRAAFKTWCQDTGKDDILSDIAMSHLVRDEIWRAYARSDLIEKRRELMEKWAAFAQS